MSARRLRVALCSVLLASVVFLAVRPGTVAAGAIAWPQSWLADSAFYETWARDDQPVVAGAATRSWVWGPVPFAVANEAYAESPTHLRLVEYLDKARMEVNDPGAERESPWFVTSGLLVTEMVTGRLQVGNASFEQRTPASVAVAGDPGSPSAPSFANFSALTGAVQRAAGKVIADRVAGDGTLAKLAPGDAPPDARPYTNVAYDDVTGHNIPAAFRDWMVQSGTVLDNGRYRRAALLDPLYVLGRPITEAYWANLLVGGKPANVLVQLFERRALTYNPQNSPEWRVEMANVGRAYYDWRYGSGGPPPAVAVEANASLLQVLGYNWVPGAAVKLTLGVPGAAPLVDMQAPAPGSAGRFATAVVVSPAIAAAIEARDDLRLTARSGDASTSLPIAAHLFAGPVRLEGVISQVGEAPGSEMTLRTRSGREVRLQLDPGTEVQFSDGDAAPPDRPGVGDAVSVDGTQRAGGIVGVTTIRLVSVSKGGVSLGYAWGADGKSIRISGSHWPANRRVSLTVGVLNAGAPPPFVTVVAESRGNFSVGAIPGASPQSAWLFAVSADGDTLLAYAGVPFDPPDIGSPFAGPPSLVISSTGGDQMAQVGSYCWAKVCADSFALAVSAGALSASAGDVLQLRSRVGQDPGEGVSPTRLRASIYAYENPPGQVAAIGNRLWFSPGAQPIHSTGDVPGRPFSVALPPSIAPGRYVIDVIAAWPDPLGGVSSAEYAFSIEVR